MHIEEVVKEREVEDYDFSFVGGSRWMTSMDESAGDRVEDLPDCFVFHTAPKPVLVDSEEETSDERTVIYKKNITAYLVRKRKQRQPVPEELLERQKLIQMWAKGPKGVQ